MYPKRNCYFCGGAPHNRLKCLARESVCHNCEIKGHFSRVCRSKNKPGKTSWNVATMYAPTLCALCVTAAFPNSLSHAALPAVIDGVTLTAHIYSCSSDNFINQQVADRLQLAISPTTCNISMTLTTLKTDVIGCCTTDITLNDCTYSNVKLSVLKDLCSDVILGHDFQKHHERLTIELHDCLQLLFMGIGNYSYLQTLSLVLNQLPQNLNVSVSHIEHLSKKRSLASWNNILLSIVHHHGAHKLLLSRTRVFPTRNVYA